MSGMWGIFGGMSAASQAEMETATSNTVGVTPLNANWHPGVAKVWLKAAGDGSAITVSWNVTSITDTGTGILDVTIATDFSSINYIIHATPPSPAPYSIKTTTAYIGAAGSFQMRCFDGSNALIDPEYYMVTCFGDQ